MRCIFSPAMSSDAVTVTGLPFSFRGLADYLEAADFAPDDNGFILPPTREHPTGVYVHGFPFALALYVVMERAGVPRYGDALNAYTNPITDEYHAVRLWKLFGALTTPHSTWPINSLAYRVHLSLSVCPFEAFPRERCATAVPQIIDKDTPAAVIREHINELNQGLQPDMRRLERLMRMEQDAQSREFIAAHGITLDQVEESQDLGDKKWFDTAWDFGDWLKGHSKKPWAAWNGIIYRASDLINHRMPEMPGRMEHLREGRQ